MRDHFYRGRLRRRLHHVSSSRMNGSGAIAGKRAWRALYAGVKPALAG
jgi:hypothetical protein